MWKYEWGRSWMRLSGSHVPWERRRGSPRSSYRRQGQVTIFLEGEAMMSLLSNWVDLSRTGFLLRINVYRVCFSNAEIETMAGKLPSLHSSLSTQASVSPEKEWCSLRIKVSLPKTHTVSGASRTTESHISTNSGPTNSKMYLPTSRISCCQEWWL